MAAQDHAAAANHADQLRRREIIGRLVRVRAGLLGKYPFFGRLALHMNFGLAECETAFTDMERIVFDPKFMSRLSDEELAFVLMHEIMHCVLKHCVRGNGLDQEAYNIACDIVVNSILLETMQREEFSVDGEPAMHLAPDGTEGRKHTAEEVYRMLMQNAQCTSEDSGNGLVHLNGKAGSGPDSDKTGKSKGRKSDEKGRNSDANVRNSDEDGKNGDDDSENSGKTLDNHSIWKNISPENASRLKDEWGSRVKSVIRDGHLAGSELSDALRRMVFSDDDPSRIRWAEILREFVILSSTHYDYDFLPPDRRFLYMDAVLPSFTPVEEATVKNIWFCLDASGSVSDETLGSLFHEIRCAVRQVPHLTGRLSWFDVKVTEPVAFEKLEDLNGVKPVGGGGTSYSCIFRHLKKMKKKPSAILILTDGYAGFPPEEAASGIPVLWIMTTDCKAPWGKTIRLPDK
ncbi:MAG: VWA-like domain-containing protein [Eubacterium sp.]|nr:VWA-like domain-containing protein [Eubacterium sp.]